MKKLILFAIITLILTACGPSEEQIQAAIQQTEQAKPTNTSTPEPTPTITNTPEPTPTPTPSFKYIRDMTNEDMVNLFMSVGVLCGDQEISSGGSYEQPCNWPIDGGLLKAEISGNSEDTVAAFMVMLVPFTGEDIKEKAIDIFLGVTEFSPDVEDIHDWILEEIDGVVYSDSETSKTLETSGLYLMLTGQNGFVLLMVMATD